MLLGRSEELAISISSENRDRTKRGRKEGRKKGEVFNFKDRGVLWNFHGSIPLTIAFVDCCGVVKRETKVLLDANNRAGGGHRNRSAFVMIARIFS